MEDLDSNYEAWPIIGKTRGGKQIAVEPSNLGVFTIKFTTGGQLPRELTGRFTTLASAKVAVSRYLVNEPVKKEVKPRAKIKSKDKL